jgi:hypothetical protein
LTRLRTAGAAALLVLVVAARGRPVLAADPPWLVHAEQLVARAGSGSSTAALAYLESLPLAVRQTADHHWIVAHAARTAGRADIAARTVAALDLLPRASGRDLTGVRSWLVQSGRRTYRRALERLAGRDRPAAAERRSLE